jgi:hypothetical protein
MTLQQTSALLNMLRANGVTYFKSDTLEVRLEALETQLETAVGPSPSFVPRGTGPLAGLQDQKINAATQGATGNLVQGATGYSGGIQGQTAQASQAQPDPVIPAAVQAGARNAGDIAVKEALIPHQMNEMHSLLKMSDEQLVDKMFPEGSTPVHEFGVR